MEGTINARSRSQTLVQAVKNNDIARVEELLNTGLDVNMMYPVVESAFLGGTHIVYKTLLTIACDRNIYREGDNIDMIKLLINYGADVNKDGRDDHISIDQLSYPPLLECVFRGRKNATKLLLKNGANPNVQRIHGSQTAIDYYINNYFSLDKYEMVEIFLKYDADPNIQNELGNTPLHSCVILGEYEMAKLLLKYGANPDIKNNDGNTPYELSKMGGFFGYSISNQKKIADFIENQKKTQEAEQKLAFMSSLNSRLGVNAFNKTGYDLYEEIASRPIEYDHSVYNRERDERRRDPLTKSKQYSAFMRGVQTNTGPFFENARYEPNIMESIRSHLSNMRPDTRLHKRIDQKSKKKTRKKKRKRKRR